MSAHAPSPGIGRRNFHINVSLATPPGATDGILTVDVTAGHTELKATLVGLFMHLDPACQRDVVTAMAVILAGLDGPPPDTLAGAIAATSPVTPPHNDIPL